MINNKWTKENCKKWRELEKEYYSLYRNILKSIQGECMRMEKLFAMFTQKRDLTNEMRKNQLLETMNGYVTLAKHMLDEMELCYSEQFLWRPRPVKCDWLKLGKKIELTRQLLKNEEDQSRNFY